MGTIDSEIGLQMEGLTLDVSQREEGVLRSRPGSSDGDTLPTLVADTKGPVLPEKEPHKFRIDSSIWPIQPLQKKAASTSLQTSSSGTALDVNAIVNGE